jgi:hypothetical protein
MKSGIQQVLSGMAALCVAMWGGPVSAVTAYGPICDTAARVECPSGTMSSDLYVSNGTCGEWNHRAMLQGNYSYRYFGGCAAACYGSTCNGGAGNYYTVTGANGWDFRQLHIFANASSGSKTCDRCVLGLVGTGNDSGPHVHALNTAYGTRHRAWTVSCGASGYCAYVMGYPRLS